MYQRTENLVSVWETVSEQRVTFSGKVFWNFPAIANLKIPLRINFDTYNATSQIEKRINFCRRVTAVKVVGTLRMCYSGNFVRLH